MPIFEYICKECDHRFEKLVFGSTEVECPSCKSAKLEKQLSAFAATTKAAAAQNKVATGLRSALSKPGSTGPSSMN
ncbi:MAG TPA: zinc ribbon domain-containing protein [Blastocatellia bacterium]|jgi:putative FmdB family regulatory protein